MSDKAITPREYTDAVAEITKAWLHACKEERPAYQWIVDQFSLALKKEGVQVVGGATITVVGGGDGGQ